MLLRSSLFEADCEARRAAPQSLRGGARLATLSFVLHASEEPVLVGTGWPTFPTLEHGGEETSQTPPRSALPPETWWRRC